MDVRVSLFVIKGSDKLIRREFPTINNVNILFLIVIVSLLSIGSIVQRNDFNTGVLITQYLMILLPSIIFLKIKKLSLKKVLKLNILSLKQAVFIFFIMLFAYPVAVFLNFIMLAMVTSVSEVMPVGIPVPDNLKDYILGLFVVAVTPGICEEVMFRGVLQTAYSKLGVKRGLIITSILFGIFHFNILNLLGPIFLGVVLGIILIKTKSLYGPILGHILNNGFVMTLGYLLSKVASDIDFITKDAPLIDNNIQIALTGIILASFALFSFIVLYILLKYLPMTKVEEDFEFEDGKKLDDLNSKVELFNEDIETIEGLMWTPIILIGGIFIYINWVYFFY